MELPKIPGLPALPKAGEIPPMSSPALAAGSFASGPKDEVATADIYKLKSAMGARTKPITSIQELNMAGEQSNFDLMPSSAGATEFMTVEPEVPKEKTLMDRVYGFGNELKASFNELDEKLKKGTLKSTVNNKAAPASVSLGGVESKVDPKNMGQVKALGGFINKYTGTKVFSGKDTGAISGMLETVIKKSSELGISGAFTTVTSTINDNGIVGRVIRGSLPMVMKKSDSKLLREFSNSKAGSLINVVSPNFTQDFAKGFTYRGDRGAGGSGGQLTNFEDVFSSFENVNDQWSTLPRGEGDNTAFNFATLASGSKDFQKLVMTGVKYWETEKKKGKVPPVPVDPMMILAGAFGEITVGSAIKRDFPKVALLSIYGGRIKRGGLPAGTRNGLNSNFMDPRNIKGTLGALFGY